MKARLLALSILTILAIAPSCTSMEETKAARGTGVEREFAAPSDVVWAADELTLELESTDDEERCILARHSASAFSFGEKIAIFVEPAGATSTRVEVVSKRSMSTNVLARDWSDDILDALERKLAAR